MTKTIDTDSLISQAAAAQLRGVSRASINELVKRGRLQAVHVAGKKLLRKSDVLKFRPEKGGRPTKRSQKVTRISARPKKKR